MEMKSKVVPVSNVYVGLDVLGEAADNVYFERKRAGAKSVMIEDTNIVDRSDTLVYVKVDYYEVM